MITSRQVHDPENFSSSFCCICRWHDSSVLLSVVRSPAGWAQRSALNGHAVDVGPEGQQLLALNTFAVDRGYGAKEPRGLSGRAVLEKTGQHPGIVESKIVLSSVLVPYDQQGPEVGAQLGQAGQGFHPHTDTVAPLLECEK